jgi:hypothetical protein
LWPQWPCLMGVKRKNRLPISNSRSRTFGPISKTAAAGDCRIEVVRRSQCVSNYKERESVPGRARTARVEVCGSVPHTRRSQRGRDNWGLK